MSVALYRMSEEEREASIINARFMVLTDVRDKEDEGRVATKVFMKDVKPAWDRMRRKKGKKGDEDLVCMVFALNNRVCGSSDLVKSYVKSSDKKDDAILTYTNYCNSTHPDLTDELKAYKDMLLRNKPVLSVEEIIYIAENLKKLEKVHNRKRTAKSTSCKVSGASTVEDKKISLERARLLSKIKSLSSREFALNVVNYDVVKGVGLKTVKIPKLHGARLRFMISPVPLVASDSAVYNHVIDLLYPEDSSTDGELYIKRTAKVGMEMYLKMQRKDMGPVLSIKTVEDALKRVDKELCAQSDDNCGAGSPQGVDSQDLEQDCGNKEGDEDEDRGAERGKKIASAQRSQNVKEGTCKRYSVDSPHHIPPAKRPNVKMPTSKLPTGKEKKLMKSTYTPSTKTVPLDEKVYADEDSSNPGMEDLESEENSAHPEPVVNGTPSSSVMESIMSAVKTTSIFSDSEDESRGPILTFGAKSTPVVKSNKTKNKRLSHKVALSGNSNSGTPVGVQNSEELEKVGKRDAKKVGNVVEKKVGKGDAKKVGKGDAKKVGKGDAKKVGKGDAKKVGKGDVKKIGKGVVKKVGKGVVKKGVVKKIGKVDSKTGGGGVGKKAGGKSTQKVAKITSVPKPPIQTQQIHSSQTGDHSQSSNKKMTEVSISDDNVSEEEIMDRLGSKFKRMQESIANHVNRRVKNVFASGMLSSAEGMDMQADAQEEVLFSDLESDSENSVCL